MHKYKESADAERRKYHEDIQEMRSKQVEMEKKQEESHELLKQLVAKFTLPKLALVIGPLQHEDCLW